MKRGSSFMEYLIIIGVVSLLLTGMNVYIKRGMQAKIKDMADYFITSKQAADTNTSSTKTESQSTSTYSSDLDTRLLPGGGSRADLSDSVSIKATSKTTDSDVTYNDDPFIPAPTGFIEPPTDTGK